MPKGWDRGVAKGFQANAASKHQTQPEVGLPVLLFCLPMAWERERQCSRLKQCCLCALLTRLCDFVRFKAAPLRQSWRPTLMQKAEGLQGGKPSGRERTNPKHLQESNWYHEYIMINIRREMPEMHWPHPHPSKQVYIYMQIYAANSAQSVFNPATQKWNELATKMLAPWIPFASLLVYAPNMSTGGTESTNFVGSQHSDQSPP